MEQKDGIVFSITESDLQIAAQEQIGRKLNDDEIAFAKKCLQWGLLTDIDSVYNAIFSDDTFKRINKKLI
ncbi:MAG: hypothetical protein LBT79_03330 [Elusimicrobiota bacterium]|jgi:hypothetical protein|nr:hypothetical protein [Elusimicrobiota bacterium]